MGLLAPLYLLGALAIAAPVIFHLIRRQPRGQTVFSSLMFLTPTPPRLSRRSRLDHWLLLLLRAAAILLLAVAFSRPFYRSHSETVAEQPGRQIRVLLDTSASMSREDLWQQAKIHVERILDSLEPQDEISLFVFDDTCRPLVVPSADGEQKQSDQIRLILTQLQSLQPSSRPTDLGKALMAVADYQIETKQPEEADPRAIQIALITDLQEGSNLERLQAYQWPENTFLDVHLLKCKKPTNAYLVLLPNDVDEEANASGMPIRLVNAADSNQADFSLGYSKDGEKIEDASKQSVHVPPGTSRIVNLPFPAAKDGVQMILLEGDEQPFDNTRYIMTQGIKSRQILSLGNDAGEPTRNPAFFLRKASLSTRSQSVEVISQPSSTELKSLDPERIPLIVTNESLSQHSDVLKPYLEAGGKLLYLLDHADEYANAQTFVKQITGEEISIKNGEVKDYRMLGWIDFKHPIFAPFADPQFNDFTKIRFWSYRILNPPEDAKNVRVIAKFDDNHPAFLEWSIGKGTVWISASGWHPEESQWALSSKFIPVLAMMFDPLAGTSTAQQGAQVGDKLEIPIDTVVNIKAASGKLQAWTPRLTNIPLTTVGLYQLASKEKQWEVGVNLALSESRTTPISLDLLEENGIKLGTASSASERTVQQRQMRDRELEQQQQWWKWIALTVLALLGIETVLGWWYSRVKSAPSTLPT